MALLNTKITDILTAIREALQDKQKTRWTDQDLYVYLEQANRQIAIDTKSNHITQRIDVYDAAHQITGVDVYPLDAEAIEFYHVTSVQPYDILNPTEIQFPQNREETVFVDYYGYYDPIIYGATLHIERERDLIDAYKYFVCSRVYQQEDNTENFQKSGYFSQEYARTIARNSSRWDGQFDVQPHKSDFYV